MVTFMDSKLSLPTKSNYLLLNSVYSDVAPTLKSWEQGFRVCIYSSGSVELKKFQYSVEGDLLPVNFLLFVDISLACSL